MRMKGKDEAQVLTFLFHPDSVGCPLSCVLSIAISVPQPLDSVVISEECWLDVYPLEETWMA